MTRLSWVMLTKPTADRTAPASIAALAETMPFSRSFPAGNAMSAWKKAQMESSQNVSDMVQPCASRRDSCGGAVAVLEDTDRHHGDPRQPDHPGPGSAEEFAVGLADAVDAVVRVDDLAITCGC